MNTLSEVCTAIEKIPCRFPILEHDTCLKTNKPGIGHRIICRVAPYTFIICVAVNEICEKNYFTFFSRGFHTLSKRKNISQYYVFVCRFELVA
jgi:hypothetical protein